MAEEKTVEILEQEAEIIKGMNVFERANLHLFYASKEAIKGNLKGFIVGMTIAEKTLLPKLAKSDYEENIKKQLETQGLDGDDINDEQRLEIALIKFSKLNNFLEAKLPLSVRGRI
jgi:hypothetical protein